MEPVDGGAGAGGAWDTMGVALLMLVLWVILLGLIFRFVVGLSRRGRALRDTEARRRRLRDDAED